MDSRAKQVARNESLFRVIERESHYVVQKVGEAGEVAERLDPRS